MLFVCASGSSFFSSMRIACSCLLYLLVVSATAGAQTPSVTTAAVTPPSELAPAVAGLLGPDVVTVTVGTTKMEFWWVKSLPVTGAASGSAPSWSQVPDGALVGALRLGANWNDIRGFGLRPGVYTLRFALQPQNGDHLGMSPFREFLLPAPAADDTAAAPAGYEGAVALAKKASRRAHPASISIEPAGEGAKPLGTTSNDMGHRLVTMSVPAPGGPLTFGVVVHGTIEH